LGLIHINPPNVPGEYLQPKEIYDEIKERGSNSAPNVGRPGLCYKFRGTGFAEDDAPRTLKAMTDYMAVQKSNSAGLDSDIEVITLELQQLQFTSSGQMPLA
jgi:hypothetical protein